MTNNPPNYRSFTLPPPVGGLNYLDPIDNMPQGDAREMKNFFPDNESVRLRKGCSSFLEVSSGNAIARLYNLPLANGTEKLVACVNNTLQEIGSGSASAITGTTTPTSDAWQGLVFKNRLFLVNGANAPQVYTGTGNASDAGFTGSGLTVADVINIAAYRGRVYLVEEDTASCWYGSVGAVTGATTEFDLSDVFYRGGYLVATGSYTNQASDSAQDLWMAVSSEGEVLFYTGSHPGDSAWSIVARYFIAKPIGYRCLIPFDSDTLILTRRGLIAVSSLFQNEQVGLSGIARKINKFIREAAETSRVDLEGWQVLYSPDQRKLIVNLPLSNQSSEQLVCNVDSGAWCLYSYNTEQPYSYSNFGSDIYYGGFDGEVFKTEAGNTDNTNTIQSDLLWAWNYFGARGNYKRFVDARPLLVGTPISGIGVRMERDFERASLSAGDIMGTSQTPWGSAWGSAWGGGTQAQFSRYGLASQGHAGALRIFGNFKNVNLELNAVEVRYEQGGQL